MIPGGDQQQRGGVRADAVQARQARRAGSDQRDDQLIQALQPGVQEPGAAAQLTQRNPGRVAGHVPGPGPQRRDRLRQLRRAVPGEPGPQLLRPGHDQRPGLVDRLGPLGAAAALGHHQRPDRLHRPGPAARPPPGRTARPAPR
jgi:hypothetical protein